MAPFEISGAVSYATFVVNIWRYLVSFARYSDLLVENRNFFTLPVFSAPTGGDTVGISSMFDTHKTRMIGLPCDEETMTIC